MTFALTPWGGDAICLPSMLLSQDNLTDRFPTKPGVAAKAVYQVDRDSADYPHRLMTLADPPSRLWFSGRLPPAAGKALAIVGSRAATGVGRACARQLATDAGERGWAVISGGALGIDAAAHEGALKVGAPTFALLGCGVDVVYPDRHESLFGEIAKSGGLLSEYPPGEPPRKGQFPARNRLIVALSDAVVVAEAARRSGALITARIAADRGCPVFALAGSPGADEFIASGRARRVAGFDEIEGALAGRAPAEPRESPAIPEALAAVVGALREVPDTADGLARRLALPIALVIGRLTEAELEGWVKRGSGGRYEVYRGH